MAGREGRLVGWMRRAAGLEGISLCPEAAVCLDCLESLVAAGAVGRPGTFASLGFTHSWGKSRKGRWVVMQKTARSRLTRAVRAIAQWCRRNRHRPLPEQHQTLSQKLRGHDASYGLPGNYRCLSVLRYLVERAWRKWLNRRSWRSRIPWDRFRGVLERFPLPPPRLAHWACRP